MKKFLVIFGSVAVMVIAVVLLIESCTTICCEYEQEVAFEYGEDTMQGSLYVPKGKTTYPAVIFIHGDGALDRTSSGGYTMLINAFLDKGIAVFSYDKAGVGASEGNWLTQTMADRADEAMAAKAIVDQLDSVTKTGYMGMSQGGWVLSEIALQGGKADFMILVSGAIDWMEQSEYMEDNRLAQSDMTEAKKQSYRAFSNEINALIVTGNYAAYAAFMEGNAYDESTMSEDRYNFVRINMDANATEGIYKIDAPFLGLFASDDVNVDANQSLSVYQSVFSERGKQDAELVMFEDATHQMLKTCYANQDGFWTQVKMLFAGRNVYTAGYLNKLGDWVNGV